MLKKERKKERKKEKGKKEKKKERKKKKKNKINIYEVQFSNSDKGLRDFTSRFTMNSKVLLVYRLFALLFAR